MVFRQGAIPAEEGGDICRVHYIAGGIWTSTFRDTGMGGGSARTRRMSHVYVYSAITGAEVDMDIRGSRGAGSGFKAFWVDGRRRAVDSKLNTSGGTRLKEVLAACGRTLEDGKPTPNGTDHRDSS